MLGTQSIHHQPIYPSIKSNYNQQWWAPSCSSSSSHLLLMAWTPSLGFQILVSLLELAWHPLPLASSQAFSSSCGFPRHDKCPPLCPRNRPRPTWRSLPRRKPSMRSRCTRQRTWIALQHGMRSTMRSHLFGAMKTTPLFHLLHLQSFTTLPLYLVIFQMDPQLTKTLEALVDALSYHDEEREVTIKCRERLSLRLAGEPYEHAWSLENVIPTFGSHYVSPNWPAIDETLVKLFSHDYEELDVLLQYLAERLGGATK